MDAYSERWVRLTSALVHRTQAAVVMFSEERTKSFSQRLRRRSVPRGRGTSRTTS